MIKKKRTTDKWYIKHAAKIHILTAFFVGRISMEFFPKWYFINLVGKFWDTSLSKIDAFGGIVGICSSILIILNLYKTIAEIIKRKRNK